MLKTIPAILGPDLLWTLAAMGHGDEIVIADANFPGASMGRRCHRLDGVSATDALEAVLRLFPLDTFVDEPATVMQVVGDPDATPPAVAEFQTILDAAEGSSVGMARIDRFAFYDRARAAFAVLQTGETRLYGNVILTKGVIAPQA